MLFLLEQTTNKFNFSPFDVFMILFTILIAAGLVRLIKSPERNKFAIGFTTIALLVFVAIDGLMVLHWFNQLQSLQDMIFG